MHPREAASKKSARKCTPKWRRNSGAKILIKIYKTITTTINRGVSESFTTVVHMVRFPVQRRIRSIQPAKFYLLLSNYNLSTTIVHAIEVFDSIGLDNGKVS